VQESYQRQEGATLAPIRSFLLALLLAGMALGWVSQVREARQAAAQPLVPGGALVAAGACAGPQAAACAALGGAGVAYAVYSDLSSDESTLLALATAVGSWWNGKSEAEQTAYAAQYVTGYWYLTPELMANMSASIGVLGAAGWSTGVSVSVPFSTFTGNADFIRFYEAAPGSGIITHIDSVTIPFPSCTGGIGTKFWKIRLYAPQGTGFVFDGQVRGYDAAGQDVSLGTFGPSGSVDGRTVATGSWVSVGSDTACGTNGWRTGYGRRLQIDFSRIAVGTPMDVHVGPVEIKYDGTTPLYSIVDTTPLWAGATTLSEGTTVRVGVPLNADDYIGTTLRNPAVPLVTGETAPAVATTAAAAGGGTSLTDSAQRGWWEGMFAGVSASVRALEARVTAISDWVTEFPAQISAALTTAFVPAVTLQTRVDALQTGLVVAAPACAVDGIVTNGSAIFDASTTGIAIPMGPYGSMTIGNDNGWLDAFRTLTGLAAWFVLAAYAVRTVRGFFGSSPGGSE